MEYGLLGAKLGHSFSKTVHDRIGKYEYELCELTEEELDTFLKAKEFKGVNVTIPYKQTVIPYLDEISERAAGVGAVNCIVNHDGRLIGDNTDFGGMLALIRHMGLEIAGRKVLILGTGGTSKTARAVMEYLQAGEIRKVSRSGADGALTYEEAYGAGENVQIIVNTTPCGMYPDVDGLPIDPARFPKLEGVLDVVYNPLKTRLVQQAEALGIPASGGLYMLIAQAVLAAENFVGLDRDTQELNDMIYEEVLRQKRNLVLIGMPGAGKSTVGRILAQRTGRELVDTDTCIVSRAGMEISDIFARHGEPYFRDLETEVIRELAVKNGLIIATGGGVPLRKQNVNALTQNGVICMLDRDLKSLLPTDDRPLSNSADKIRSLYQERYPIYCSAADVRIPVEGRPGEVAEAVLEKGLI